MRSILARYHLFTWISGGGPAPAACPDLTGVGLGPHHHPWSSLTCLTSSCSSLPSAPSHSSSCWAVVWGQCAFMTRKPRRISVKSTSMMTCPGELEAARCTALCGLVLCWAFSPSYPSGGHGVLTPPHVCCRILSLACSPNGASFVCSAAAPSLASQVDFSALDIGSKGTNHVPGKLLLWDTKTMKQQVRAYPPTPGPRAGHTPGGHRARAPSLLSLSLSLLWSSQTLICEETSKCKC